MEKENIKSLNKPNPSETKENIFSRDGFMRMFHPYGNIFQAEPSEPILLVQYGLE